MTRAAKATIDLDAIRHNYRLAKQLAPAAKAVAVVKANAYGHGAVAVARALASEADAFGVACIEEAIELREAGIDNRMLLLEGFFEPSELPLIDRLRLDTAVHSPFQVDQLLAHNFKQPTAVWLKMDSGMHRLGMTAEELQACYRRLDSNPRISERLLMSHFAQADETHCERTREQLEAFKVATQTLDAPVSLANSPAILAWPLSHGDWVRPGMMLYGASPLEQPNANGEQLRPAMVLESQLIAIRELAAGEPVGYGARYRCPQPRRIGVVAMGYGDGYPRHAKDGTPVLVNGVRCPLVGRVSMDMLTVDLTALDQVNLGDRVVLWGEGLPVEEVAQWCDTIPYELVTTLTLRVPRHYR